MILVRRLGAVRAEYKFRKYPPCFVIGAPRSGTSILFRIIESFQKLNCIFEPKLVWYKSAGRPGIDGETYYYSTIDSKVKQRIYNEYYQHFDRERPVMLIKDPRNSLRLNHIKGLFPGSKFILVTRHPLDVIASIKKTSIDPFYSANEYWPHMLPIGHRFFSNSSVEYKAILLWHYSNLNSLTLGDKIGNENFLLLRYEDIIKDGMKEISKIGEFLSIPDIDTGLIVNALQITNNPKGNDAGSGTMSKSSRIGGGRKELDPDTILQNDIINFSLMKYLNYS